MEQRKFLSFAPTITAPASVISGQQVNLQLTSAGNASPNSWSINWGDPAHPGTETVAGANTSWPHVYPSAGSYTITAAANTTYTLDFYRQPAVMTDQ